MAEQSTLFGLASEIKRRIKEGKFKGTKDDIEQARKAHKDSISINRKIGQQLRYGKITQLDYDKQKEDTKWYKNRLNMLDDKPFYFEIDNRFPLTLWGKSRPKWRISNKSIEKYSSDRIEGLILSRLQKGLAENISKEKRPTVMVALENFKRSVDEYIDALKEGKRPENLITGKFDFDEPEIEIEITGS